MAEHQTYTFVRCTCGNIIGRYQIMFEKLMEYILTPILGTTESKVSINEKTGNPFTVKEVYEDMKEQLKIEQIKNFEELLKIKSNERFVIEDIYNILGLKGGGSDCCRCRLSNPTLVPISEYNIEKIKGKFSIEKNEEPFSLVEHVQTPRGTITPAEIKDVLCYRQQPLKISTPLSRRGGEFKSISLTKKPSIEEKSIPDIAPIENTTYQTTRNVGHGFYVPVLKREIVLTGKRKDFDPNITKISPNVGRTAAHSL